MSALGREARRFAVALPDGIRLFVLAPVIVAIPILVEFAQHAVEVQIGLFESRDRFAALALDPRRMTFGYGKIAAIWVSTFLAARFWVNRRAGRPWWSLASIAWRPLLVGLGLSLLVSIPITPGLGLPPMALMATTLAVTIVSMPLMVLMMAGLLGDAGATLRGAYTHGWGKALRILAFTLLAFLPLQGLHYANHTFALGQPAALVWAIMAWDSVLVGAMAAIMGTVLHHGYAPSGS